ncbi:transglycosylase SLT domain-containing protein [Polymorphobacter sp.]|uniref:transglycosylase SLT domain-containing protein n=1 Tax=Polymorphobacter sp. TaxID=1909290 RepID=UPI003F71F449
MSSIVAKLGLAVVLASPASGQITTAQISAPQISDASRAVYTARLANNAAGRFNGVAASPLASAAQVPILDAVVTWDRLRRENYRGPFSEYAAFLATYPDFPQSLAIRRYAERAMTMDVPPLERLAYFDRNEPLSAAAKLRKAEALLAQGRRNDANAVARDAWDSAGLDEETERALIEGFESVLRPEDHLGRAERLLWNGQITAAGRLLPRLDMDRRLWLLARIGTRGNSPDAQARLNGVPASLRRDPGLVRDEAMWLRRNNRLAEAHRLLIDSRPTPGSIFDPQQWMATRLELGRAAWRAGDPGTAYALMATHNSYAPRTAVIERSLSERQVYVDLEWLAGWLALRKLARPLDAAKHFENVRAAAQTPLSQSRGDYWAGRAYEAAGRSTDSRRAYAAAARHPDYFYGQLAIERLGQPYALRISPAPLIDPNAQSTFRARPLVRAAEALGGLDDRDRQLLFLRAIVGSAVTPEDHALIAGLAPMLGRLDLGVNASKALRGLGEAGVGIDAGIPLYEAGWPMLPLPESLASRQVIIHAITRQESQFDRTARSPANARGMMQLLPGTAAETAGKIGMPVSTERLFTDPVYNVTLGSAYYLRMRDTFGSDVLAVAAYNAGPGNARKFITQNGDPRAPSVDIVDWIEAIPFSETRNYVQRVLENAVVYEQRLGLPQTATPLSRWLGKSTPG